MQPHALPQPGLIWGLYPEKRAPGRDNALSSLLATATRRWLNPGLRRYEHIAQRSLEIEAALHALTGAAYNENVRTLKQKLVRDGLSTENIAQAFALTGVACRRHLGITPFATQIGRAHV
jgi:preprotein translocase subunit SecA